MISKKSLAKALLGGLVISLLGCGGGEASKVNRKLGQSASCKKQDLTNVNAGRILR